MSNRQPEGRRIGGNDYGELAVDLCSETGEGICGAIRVVILGPDPEIRKILHEIIGEWPEFLFVDESRSWKECKALLDIYLSELFRDYRLLVDFY
jgi:hypothetical protein